MNMPRLVKLSTNEEVIFKCIDDTADTVTMSYPITLHVVPQNEQYGLQLFPYSPSCPDGVHTLHKSHIVTECVNIPEGLIKAYIQRTTGIEIASAIDAFSKLK